LLLFIGIQLIIAAVQWLFLGNSLVNLWVGSFGINILWLLVGVGCNKFISIGKFHKIFLHGLFNLFATTICLLVNSLYKELTFYYNFLTIPKVFNPINSPFLFVFDSYNLSFVSLTVGISLYVFPFTLRYMKEEPMIFRFYLLLGGFVSSMILLLIGNN
jgi:NADH:ubiquinone oxidoreductase subunit 5 (subunit L)/multisubunit Na+/H+ antiporter MnhA subunit